MSSAWLSLIGAGLLEIVWAIGLKYTAGFTKLTPSAITIVALVGSMYLLARATHSLPIGTAYAIWVGIGALGTAILGIVLFQESASLPRLIFLAMLLIAIVGLKLTGEQP